MNKDHTLFFIQVYLYDSPFLTKTMYTEYTLGTLHLVLGLLSITCNLTVIWNYLKEGGFRNTCYFLFINLGTS